ncbi:hypothetical protein [Sporosarcina ureae]|uniref:Uncharacterized protein n=1 Tax=Sporosarcina ureae TaxID=1571 RepID=A0ABM6JTV6_SPOUR|nr:hypothetical protein [Sporosarcina ureae]ARF13519.1 hypothetical protein SporoS204_04690 [Sporosarcina ureae]
MLNVGSYPLNEVGEVLNVQGNPLNPAREPLNPLGNPLNAVFGALKVLGCPLLCSARLAQCIGLSAQPTGQSAQPAKLSAQYPDNPPHPPTHKKNIKKIQTKSSLFFRLVIKLILFE